MRLAVGEDRVRFRPPSSLQIHVGHGDEAGL